MCNGSDVVPSIWLGQAAALERVLYQMPELSGQVPVIFVGEEGEEPDPEEVAMLLEQGGAAAAGHQEAVPEPELVE